MWSREGGGESVRKWELQSSPIIWETSERCAYPSHARICTKKFGSYVHENMNAVSFKYKPVIHYRTLKTCPSTKFYIRERHPKIAEQLCPSANLYLWETFYSYVPDLLPVNRITGKLFLQIFFSNRYFVTTSQHFGDVVVPSNSKCANIFKHLMFVVFCCE